MKFNRRARLDAGQVVDRRGARVPGGKAAIGAGGGLVGLVVMVALVLLGGGSGDQVLFDPGAGQYYDASGQGWSRDLSEECRTGADAEEREDCRIVGIVNSVQRYWTDEMAERATATSRPTQLFTSAPWRGGSQLLAGPFYCPADRTVYMDLSFSTSSRTPVRPRADRSPAYVVA